MLSTTQQVGLIPDPDQYRVELMLGLPTTAYDARIIGPAATLHEFGGDDDSLTQYVVAVRADAESGFTEYYQAVELGFEAAGIQLVGLIGTTEFENAIIEAFIPDGVDFEE